MNRKKRTIRVNETATFLSLKLKSEEVRRDRCVECGTEVTWVELPMVIALLTPRLGAERVFHLRDGRLCSRSLITYLNNLNKEKG